MQLSQLADAPQSDGQVSPPGSAEVASQPLTDLSAEEAVSTVMDTVSGIVQSVLAHVPMLVAGALVLAITFVVVLIANAAVRRLLKRSKLRGSLRELAVRFTSIVVWGVGLLVAALVVFPGLTPSKALAGLGVGSIAIGLAFKDIFENFFAGVLILWKFPFENGDFISCDGILGKVEDVSIRNTLVRTVEGDLVIIPNATLYKNAVDVLTDDDVRRISIIVGVAYGEDIDKSRDVIADAVRSCDSVRNDPAP
ncbi:MAG: mechanosensitive ion channel domain-containing protein, partial [Planctomycetota bacterium]